MAKFSRHPKLSKEYRQEMIVDLCDAIAGTKSSEEAAELLTDLLGAQEMEMIAKRLRVAELLLQDYLYEDICKELRVSPSTISRVQIWLQNAGEGYRKILERTRQKRSRRQEVQAPVTVRGIKEKYPLYFWPQIILEHWVKNASQKQKNEMRKILSKMDSKTKAYKELENLLRTRSGR